MVARSIFCFGFFTEKFLRSEISYRKNDYRSLWSRIQIESWRKGLDSIKNLNYKVNIENTAIRFVLTEKMVSCALVGVRSVLELENNLSNQNFKKLNKNFF